MQLGVFAEAAVWIVGEYEYSIKPFSLFDCTVCVRVSSKDPFLLLPPKHLWRCLSFYLIHTNARLSKTITFTHITLPLFKRPGQHANAPLLSVTHTHYTHTHTHTRGRAPSARWCSRDMSCAETWLIHTCRDSSDTCLCIDDDCFYYHSWRNDVVIACGTLSSFLTQLHIVIGVVCVVCRFAGD